MQEENKYVFIVKENSIRKLIHTLSRYEIVARCIHVAIHLGLHKIIDDNQSISISDIHRDLISQQKIENLDINPLTRLLKFLSCYGIFKVYGNTVQHTVLSQALNGESVIKSIFGLNEEEWKKQGDLLNYLSNVENSKKVLISYSQVDITLDINNISLIFSAETSESLLTELANLNLLSRAIYTVAELNLADLIYDGINTISLLVEKTNQNQTALTTLIAILLRFKILTERTGHLYLTEAGQALMEGENSISIKAAARMANIPWWNAIGKLGYCIETGKSPYVAANGISVFEYLEANKNQRIKFDKGLANSDADQDSVVANVDGVFEGYHSIVDIGGGNGGLITHLVERYPTIKAILFEQPGTIEHLQNNLLSDTNSPLNKCQLQSGNFLDSFKKNGIPRHKDLYIIKGVLHDFTDEEVVIILKNIRHAMSNHSKLKIIERYVDDDNKPHLNKIGDMQMMAFFGSKERSFNDYKRLANEACLLLDENNIRSCGNYNIIIATPNPMLGKFFTPHHKPYFDKETIEKLKGMTSEERIELLPFLINHIM